LGFIKPPTGVTIPWRSASVSFPKTRSYRSFNPTIDAIAHRPSFQNRAHYGFGNAILLTGDRRYADIWGRMIDIVNSNAVQENGRTVYPNSFGDQGWYNFTPEKFAHGALEVYYWSMDEQDAMRVLNDD